MRIEFKLAFGVILVVVLATSTTHSLPQQSAAQAMVDGFYPVGTLRPSDDTDRRSCFLVADERPDGTPRTIVAGYTDTVNAALRILRKDAAGAYGVVAREPEDVTLYGSDCEVRLIDLDFDTRPEIEFTGTGMRGETTWLFRWDGAELTNLSPLDPRLGSSELDGLGLYDLSHRGPLQAIAGGPDGPLSDVPVDETQVAYVLTPNRYVKDRPLLEVVQVDPTDLTVRAINLATDSVGPYILRVINGDRTGARRVKSGSVVLNDIEVMGPEQITSWTEFAEVALGPTLPVASRLQVAVHGNASAYLIVVIEDSGAIARARNQAP